MTKPDLEMLFENDIFGKPNLQRGRVVEVETTKGSKRMEKPPLGLEPKWIHDENRKHEVASAIKRYIDADLKVPEAWIEEYSSLAGKTEDSVHMTEEKARRCERICDELNYLGIEKCFTDAIRGTTHVKHLVYKQQKGANPCKE
jgi:hypothetical protein